MTKEMSIATRNILALRGLGTMAPRTLQRAQDRYPSYRAYSSQGMPFPCPANGVIKDFYEVDCRETKPKDIPEGMVAPKRRKFFGRAQVELGKSKWPLQYMASGASIAFRLAYSKTHELYWSEYQRVRNIGMSMMSYQKKRGYIDKDFILQTSEADISVYKLKNGDDVLAPHIVFWRIDGTDADPAFQGTKTN